METLDVYYLTTLWCKKVVDNNQDLCSDRWKSKHFRFIYSLNSPIEGGTSSPLCGWDTQAATKYFVRFQMASKMVELEFGHRHFDIDHKHFVSLLAHTKAEHVSHSKPSLLTHSGETSMTVFIWGHPWVAYGVTVRLWYLLIATACWSGSDRLPLVSTAASFHTLPSSEAEVQRGERTSRR